MHEKIYNDAAAADDDDDVDDVDEEEEEESTRFQEKSKHYGKSTHFKEDY